MVRVGMEVRLVGSEVVEVVEGVEGVEVVE